MLSHISRGMSLELAKVACAEQKHLFLTFDNSTSFHLLSPVFECSHIKGLYTRDMLPQICAPQITVVTECWHYIDLSTALL